VFLHDPWDDDRQRTLGVLFLDLGNLLHQAADKAPVGRGRYDELWCCQPGAARRPLDFIAPLTTERPLKREREWLLARLAEKPDLTLRAVVAELAERGTPASYGAMARFFKHEGITFKKSLHARRAGSRRHCSPPAGPGGRRIRAGLTPSAWCSSTRPGRRPT